MLNPKKLIAFLATTNAAAARKFYCDQLGFVAVYEDSFALVLDAQGTELRLQKLKVVIPQPFTVLGWSVESISKSVKNLTGAGLIFERFDGMNLSKHGVWRAPSEAQIAWFKDPDGNMLSLTQHSTSQT
jgi:catechol 2,3-dioxygenase-like lactoylglutathione lyase family enzyme